MVLYCAKFGREWEGREKEQVTLDRLQVLLVTGSLEVQVAVDAERHEHAQHLAKEVCVRDRQWVLRGEMHQQRQVYSRENSLQTK
jgi:hypothetical protein